MNTLERKGNAAFTLVELMTGLTCGSILLAALLAAGVSLQRSFAAVEAYSGAEGDQVRVQDYIAMDCRRAIAVQVDTGAWTNSGGTWSWVSNAGGTQTLLVTLPAYFDASTKNPVAPYLDSNGKVQYGPSGSTSFVISYYKNGSDFVRQVGNDPTAAKPFGLTKIATNVSDFNVTPVNQATVNGTVACSVTFSPRFQSLTPRVAGTTVYCATFLRNGRARQ